MRTDGLVKTENERAKSLIKELGRVDKIYTIDKIFKIGKRFLKKEKK